MGDEEGSSYKVEYLVGVGDEAPETTNWIARAGLAKVTYESGSIYEGEFNDEKQKHGKGKFTWMSPANEDEEQEAKVLAVYEGQYKDGKRCGEGKMTYPNGDAYHGEWNNNDMSGTGTYKYKNSDIYSGGFVGGLKHGKGVYEFGKDGSRLDGTWEKGAFSTGKWLFKNAGSYEGTYDNGQPTGPGAFTFPNGITHTGEYKAAASASASEDDDGGAAPAPRTWHGNPVYAN